MNNKGQVFGFALLILFFFFLIGVIATIDPFKEVLDNVRGNTALNCKGTPDFNQTLYDIDNNDTNAQLNKRTTCFATGLIMIWFVGAFLLASVVWLVRNFKVKPR